MNHTEALGFVGSCCMRTMGVLLVMADNVTMPDAHREYIEKQRTWYGQQQDMLALADMIDEAMGGKE